MATKPYPEKIIQGGYSDIRLWPCYMLISSLMLFLMPQIGAFWSTLVVMVPFILFAKWVADRQPKEVFEYEAWKKDLDLFVENNASFPDPANYWHTEYKKPKIKLEKTKHPKMAGVLPATAKS